MRGKIEALRERFLQELQGAQNSEAVEKLRVAYLGKKGSVTELLKGLKDVAGDQKKEMGQHINQLKKQVETEIAAQVEKIHAAEEEALIASAEQYDVTLPTGESEGSYHPITLVQRQLEEIFASMGFTIEDYKEIVTDYECFEAVNIPKDHPARDMQDTYYLSNGQLLKTHTSAAQNAILRKYGAPLRAIFPGRCFPQRGHRCLPREHLLPDGGHHGGQEHLHLQPHLLYEDHALPGVRAGHQRAAAPRLLPLRGARLRDGHLLPHLRRRGLPQLQEFRLAGAVPLRHDPPQRAQGRGHRPRGVHRLRLGLGLTRLVMMKYGVKDIRDLKQRQPEGVEPI